MQKLGGSKLPFAAQRKQVTVEDIKQKTRGAAEMFEKQFLREMVKSMRQTVPQNGLIKKNQAENIFQEKLDHEYVENWGAKGGIGLSNLIYDQIMERFGAQMGIRNFGGKPQGPIQLQKSQNMKMSSKTLENGKSFHFRIEPGKSAENHANAMGDIVSPWPGVLVDVKKLDPGPLTGGRWLGEIQHDNGLKSKILSPQKIEAQIGDSLKSGEKLGQVSLGSDLVWQVEGKKESVVKNVSL